MLRDILAALFEPRAFFAALRARPASARRAFAALLVPVALGGIVELLGIRALLGASDPALARSLEHLGRGVFVAAIAVGVLLGVPTAALVLWGNAWLPLRIGVGARPRLGELAAWTQLPSALVAMVTFAASGLGVALRAPLPVVLGTAGTAWSGWLVYEALGAFAPDARARGVVVWALFAGLLAGLAASCQPLELPGASGPLVF